MHASLSFLHALSIGHYLLNSNGIAPFTKKHHHDRDDDDFDLGDIFEEKWMIFLLVLLGILLIGGIIAAIVFVVLRKKRGRRPNNNAGLVTPSGVARKYSRGGGLRVRKHRGHYYRDEFSDSQDNMVQLKAMRPSTETVCNQPLNLTVQDAKSELGASSSLFLGASDKTSPKV